MKVTIDDAVRQVVRSGNCSGCGACTLLDGGLEMQLDEQGYARPVRVSGGAEAASDAAGPGSGSGAASGTAPASDAAVVRSFRASCPGVRMPAQRPAGTVRHPTMGPVYRAWAASASDATTRHRGSSGGAITALTTWLLENGEASSVVGARAAQPNPRRTVSLKLQTREEALASAGSRYAPTSSAGVPGVLDAAGAVVGKPCEVSALSAIAADGPQPLLISFFCAGTPSQHATDNLVASLGLPAEAPLRDLWYRGRGWPGRFTAIAADDRTASMSYDESWGGHLGPTTQWRCKVCPDGVGESADIVAADYWNADAHGYPSFVETDGVSALIARTARGADVVERAIAAGVLTVAPLNIDRLAAMQPLQRNRRELLLGRLIGARLAGRRVPKYPGFGLLLLALRRPLHTLQTARGSYRRVRDQGVRS